MIRQCPHPFHHTLPLYEVHTDAEGVTVAQYHDEEMLDSVYLHGDDGSGIVVRKGDGDDWAAYYVDADQNEQSGSLTKMSPRNTMWRVVDELVKESYPKLTYRP